MIPEMCLHNNGVTALLKTQTSETVTVPESALIHNLRIKTLLFPKSETRLGNTY